jgi:hypothetical protein
MGAAPAASDASRRDVLHRTVALGRAAGAPGVMTGP